MQDKYLKEATYISAVIEDYFGNKVSQITPGIDSGYGYPWFKVEFVMYRTYRFCYEYEKGYYSIVSANDSGIYIEFSENNKSKFNNKSNKRSIIIKNLSLLDEEVRLRLPEKFLKLFD